ncbi:GNAT family N-acetyltransferase [Pseudemcibacter aquimaris]|uniref:GNAT family N-acetyltransferase n=1 Tax=Pseudemcibacter aquimaris TaxID=2857064 RepID=UPI0020134079|nr:GNAT family N-acetyltransferase [Pseudemcibacter aquimaris]MCC3861862.1 GNAT family N-acetyltransferase [Pseudemcibacter aquimaris]WDU58615.1 GNAT family N-acetyltransferase [Pseudemcibacter aquimaris]
MNIRDATDNDRDFILGLSPTLIENASLAWHSDQVEREFQDRFIEEVLDNKDVIQQILIAEDNGERLGFIQVEESEDEVSLETCAKIQLLAVTKEAQGKGVGSALMNRAVRWAKEKGFRLISLEVFANNKNARAFYEAQGFQNDTMFMVKPLD